ncbi:MAG: hypothetical protein LC723_04935, partial [Actinobacteria bacterium]|nr:hypothetical protein [Actinomycetota bacterium]
MTAQGSSSVPVSRSISTKLVAAMIATALLSVFLVSLVGIRLIRQAADRYAFSELRREADSIASEANFLQKNPTATLRFLRRVLDLPGTALYQMNGDSAVTLLGGNQAVPITASDIVILSKGQVLQGIRETHGGRVLFVAEPLQDDASLILVLGHRVGLLETRLPIGRSVLWAAIIAVAAAALLSLY